jgi:hypothetical protein
LRICLSMLKRNEPAAAPLRRELLSIRGVISVSINCVSGSIIIHYDRDGFDPAALWSTLHRMGFIAQESPRSVSQKPAQTEASGPAAEIMKILASAVLEQWLGRPAGMLIASLI